MDCYECAIKKARIDILIIQNNTYKGIIADLQATVRGLTESYRNLELMAHDLHDSISGSLEDCTGMGKD
jgi:hypothetical protein